ncbi:zf-HC2 domain-containing protein [Streptomyces sp. NRRL S-37]|uniref:zf-HC2 domain-containing protein n=1 Tax=Streptomyces sp. NRRL S-37 TaxID=1463903 RepID=UPI0004C4E224|nr:zf-HC2 domain-containing protein [Streptomyces sp. NRRL S-37]
MTGWHASDHLVTRYADGCLPEADAWSLEKHLESCAGCALRVSRAVRATAAGPALAGIREAVLAEVHEAVLADARETARPDTGTAARTDLPETARPHTGTAAPTDSHGTTQTHTGAAARTGVYKAAPAGAVPAAPACGPVLGVPVPARPAGFPGRAGLRTLRWPSAGPRTVRVLWALGPAVRGAWLPAVLLVAVGAVALAHGAGFAHARPWLLALAPVVPVAGVALSYGPHADPMHEITAATPSAGLRVVLMRTAAVLAVSLPLLTLAGALLPSTGAPNAAAWLLPGLALTLASLALAGYVGLRAATAVTGGGWLCAVLGPVLAAPGGPTAELGLRLSSYLGGAPAQGGWAAAALLSAALLAARRPAFHFLEKS